jgi:hypothetical protein
LFKRCRVPGVYKRLHATGKSQKADISAQSPEVCPAGRREMKLIALQAMLNQLVIRDDSVTKLECVIMAGVVGKSRPRPQRQQHNGCTGKLQIHLHLYLLLPKKSRIATAPPPWTSLNASSKRAWA